MKQSLTLAVLLAASLSAGCQNKLFQRIPGTNSGVPFGTSAKSMEAIGRHDDRGIPAFDARSRQSFRDARMATASTPRFNAVDDDLNRGRQAASQGRLDEAAGYYRRVLANQPNHPMAHHLLAIIADKQLDYRTAEQHYLSALQADAHNPDLLGNLGYSYLLQKRYRESERMLSRSLQVRPRHEKTLNNLGLLYSQEGDYQRALATFRRGGTEADAQRKMAELFPRGSGTPSDFPGAFQPDPNVRLASEQRDPNAASSHPLPVEQASGLSDTTSNQTNRLKQMMEQARLESQRQRRQRQNPGFVTDAAHLTAPKSPQHFSQFPNHAQPGSRIPQRAIDQFPPRGVADHQINDAFSQIDARRDRRNLGSRYRDRTTNIPPFPTSRDWGSAPIPGQGPSPGTATHINQTATSVTHPETSSRTPDMSALWPPPNASSRPIAPASFHESAASRPITSPATSPTPSRQAAALAGMNAGPGVLFPVSPSGRAVTRTPPATLPTTSQTTRLAPVGQLPRTATLMNHQPSADRFPGTAAAPRADALDVYQAEIERHNREISELNRLMQRERQLPAGGGAAHPGFPQRFNAPTSAAGRFDSPADSTGFPGR